MIVNVNDLEQLKQLQVNRLAVLQSSKIGQHLIGFINQVTRKKVITDLLDENDEPITEQNLCKISLIGSLLDVDGF